MRKIAVGSVVQYGSNNKSMYHSQFCCKRVKSSTGKPTLEMAQHTDNRSDFTLEDYIAAVKYPYVHWYNMSNLK